MITQGWKRLFIVLSLTWLVGSIAWCSSERHSINFFEQFDETQKTHIFWQWSQPITSAKPLATDVKSGREAYPRSLNIRPIVTLAVMLTPILLLWIIGWCVSWVNDGFNRRK